MRNSNEDELGDDESELTVHKGQALRNRKRGRGRVRGKSKFKSGKEPEPDNRTSPLEGSPPPEVNNESQISHPPEVTPSSPEDVPVDKDKIETGDSETSENVVSAHSVSSSRDRSKRRGRSTRQKHHSSSNVSAKALENSDSSTLSELDHCDRLFHIFSKSKISPFLDKPSIFMFGMSNYYNIIKKPMWLKEIKRKLNDRSYQSVLELVSDIKLMLENCYKFWGPNHRLTNLALIIENKLKSAIESLPIDLQEKCNENFIKQEPSEFCGRLIGQDDSYDSEGDASNGNNNILPPTDNVDDNPVQVQSDVDESIMSWENNLISSDTKFHISSSWHLAAIGQFLRKTHQRLNLPEIRQYELERMLAMPKESITLSTLMTAMLNLPPLRITLDAAVPIMPYEVWNKKLHSKVEEWCSLYNASSKLEVFMARGIEPLFWSSLNFAYTSDFSDLTFFQRSVILKALCDNLYHMEKNIQELFLDEEGNENAITEFQLGCFGDHMYFFFPCWPDVRVYKQRMLSKSEFERINEDVGITTRLILNICVNNSSQSNVKDLDISDLFKDFELVAENESEVKALAGRGSSAMAVRVAALGRETSRYKQSFRVSEIRSSMYHQYHAESSPEDTAYRIRYWDNFNKTNGNHADLFVEGKRQRKEILRNNYDENSDSDDNADIFEGFANDEEGSSSDWEPSEKKKKSNKSKEDNRKENLEDKQKKRSKKKGTKKCLSPIHSTGLETSKTPAREISMIKIEKDIDGKRSEKDIDTPSIVTVESLNECLKPSKDFNLLNQSVTIKEEVKIIKQEPPSIQEKPAVSMTLAPKSIERPAPKEVKVKQEIIDLSSDDDEPTFVSATPVKQSPLIRPSSVSPRANLVRTPRPLTSSPRMLASPRTPTMPQMSSPNRYTSPRNSTPVGSPRASNFSPLQRLRGTPPLNPSPGSNVNPRFRAISPRSPANVASNVSSSRPVAQRNLFNSPQTNKQRPAGPPPPPNTIPCQILVGQRSNGSFGYIARLEDGGVFDMSPDEVSDIRQRNKGGIPNIVYLPRGRLGF